jgi:serine/threonine-protein kinase
LRDEGRQKRGGNAVKSIRPDLAAHPATAARFAREVHAVTGLTHVNTVRVYDYGRADDGSFYFVMEYLEGPTLEELVQETGPLPPGRVVYLLWQLCGALVEAHGAGLVHRDLKTRQRDRRRARRPEGRGQVARLRAGARP